jgi:hypothetical protein
MSAIRVFVEVPEVPGCQFELPGGLRDQVAKLLVDLAGGTAANGEAAAARKRGRPPGSATKTSTVELQPEANGLHSAEPDGIAQ